VADSISPGIYLIELEISKCSIYAESGATTNKPAELASYKGSPTVS
jgi:hypothetical protein